MDELLKLNINLSHHHSPPPMDSSEIEPTPISSSSSSPPPSTEPTKSLTITEQPSKIPIRPQKIRKLDKSTSSPLTINNPQQQQQPTSSKSRRKTPTQISKSPRQIIKPLTADNELHLAIQHLRVADPLLVPLIDSNPPPHFEAHHRPFLSLTKSILYQQLAYKAGNSIYNRFISLCGGEDSVRPDNVLALSSQELKQIGVSGRKATYLYDLANKYNSGILSDDRIVKMDDRSLFTMLSMVKGIGSWSVHMFMIFSLHRPDVLPVSDLGVRKGVRFLYGLDELPRPSMMEHLCEKWRPYRSVGAWYMWRFVEGKEGPTAGTGIAVDGGIGQSLQGIEGQQDGGHQLPFVEPVNGVVNLGSCIWNQ